MVLHNEERRSWLQPWKPSPQALQAPVCSLALPPAAGRGWAGPRIRMHLPSFSGATPECPQLLQYACQLHTNVRAVPAARVEVSTVCRCELNAGAWLLHSACVLAVSPHQGCMHSIIDASKYGC